MPRPLAWASLACLLGAALAAEKAQPPADTSARLIAQLNDESCAVRDRALEALAALGQPAVPELERAAKNGDAETRWRAKAALRRIRWRIGPRLAARIGDLMVGFERRPVGEREMICRDLAMVGLTDAVQTLTQVLKTDNSKAVRQAAARALVLLGDDGLAALLEAGIKTEGLNAYTVAVRIHLGNSYLERGEFPKALEQYFDARKIEPKNSIVHYNIACTYSRMKKLEDALDALERSVECGYRDVDWMEKDSDLDNIRDTGRYKAIVRKLREKD